MALDGYTRSGSPIGLYEHHDWPRPWRAPARWLVWPEWEWERDDRGEIPVWPSPIVGEHRRLRDGRPGYRYAAWLWVPGTREFESDDLWTISGGGQGLELATRSAMRSARDLERERDDFARRLEALEPDAWERARG